MQLAAIDSNREFAHLPDRRPFKIAGGRRAPRRETQPASAKKGPRRRGRYLRGPDTYPSPEGDCSIIIGVTEFATMNTRIFYFLFLQITLHWVASVARAEGSGCVELRAGDQRGLHLLRRCSGFKLRQPECHRG